MLCEVAVDVGLPGSVAEAAGRVGMSPRSAYRLRRRPGAEAFDKAWEQAIALAARSLTSIAFDRAVRGAPRGVWHKGELVGEEHVPSDKMLMFLLRHHDPQRYGDFLGLRRRDGRDPAEEASKALPRLLGQLREPDAGGGAH